MRLVFEKTMVIGGAAMDPVLPVNTTFELSNTTTLILALIIGFGFGFILEKGGLGDSRKLAKQFYFQDLTVFKVMFTAIVVAMVGLLLLTSLGVLDADFIHINSTYLWPGIIGGLVMGVGFVIGGY